MIFQGSKMVKIHCLECGKESEPLKATLSDEGWFIPENKMGGWFVIDEAKLDAYDVKGNLTDLSNVKCGSTFGLCPQHNAEMLDEHL